MTEIVGLIPRTYSYLIDDSGGDKKNRCVIKKRPKCENVKKCFQNLQQFIKEVQNQGARCNY